MSYKFYQNLFASILVLVVASGIYFACGAGGPTGNVVTSFTVDGSGGLVQTGTIGAVTAVGLRKDCTSGFALTWSGTAWVCTAISGGGLSTVTADSPLAGLGTTGSHLTWTPTLTAPLAGTGSAGSPLNYVPNVSAPVTGTGSAGSPLTLSGTYVNSLSPISGGGLSLGGGGTGAVTIGMNSCSAGQGLVEVSGSYACSNLVTGVSGASGAGVGVSAASGSVGFRLTGLSGVDCSANQLLEDVSGAQDWRCVNFPTAGTGTVTSITAGTGLSASPSSPITGAGTLNVNLTTTSCTAGNAETATAANGTSTCSAVVNSIVGTAPIVSSVSAGVDTLSLNLTTTACAAGKAETATSALGVGTCNFFFNTAGTNLTASSNTVSLVSSPSVSGSLTAATGITSSGGNITASAGSVSAGTTVTSGTDVIAGRWFQSSGNATTINSCGVGGSVSGNDVAGRITIGSSATTCSINWGNTHGSSPVGCSLTPASTGITNLFISQQNTFGLALTCGGTCGAGTGQVVDYVCIM